MFTPNAFVSNCHVDICLYAMINLSLLLSHIIGISTVPQLITCQSYLLFLSASSFARPMFSIFTYKIFKVKMFPFFNLFGVWNQPEHWIIKSISPRCPPWDHDRARDIFPRDMKESLRIPVEFVAGHSELGVGSCGWWTGDLEIRDSGLGIRD